MNTKALNSLAELICRAQGQDRTPMGIAFAIDAAGRHMSPEVAAELEWLRARVAELEAAERRRTDTLERCRLDAAERAERETDPGRRAAWRMLAGQTSEGEHYASVHHTYRVPRDLPETGGAR